MQCVQKLCNVSINYAVCPEVMQCVHKLYRVFRKYTGCPESVYNLGAHLQGQNDFFLLYQECANYYNLNYRDSQITRKNGIIVSL